MAELDLAAQMVVIKDRKCELCDLNSVTWKCLNCNEAICDHCKSTHIKSKAGNNHKVVSLTDVDNLYSIGNEPESNTKCMKHLTEDLLMYCTSCIAPVCRRCIANGSHRRHSFSAIDDVIDKKKCELSKIAMKSKERVKEHEDRLQCIHIHRNDFNAEIARLIKQIQNRNEDMKQKLDQITSEFIEKVQNRQKQNFKQTSDLENRLQNEIKELRELVQQCERKRSERNIQIVKCVADMNERLNSFILCDQLSIGHPPSLVSRNVDIRDLKELFGDLVESKHGANSQLRRKQEAKNETKDMPDSSINVMIFKGHTVQQYGCGGLEI